MAFYNETKQTVSPITSGYRLILTYDLVQSGEVTSQCHNDRLTGSGQLPKPFKKGPSFSELVRAAINWRDSPSDSVEKLVYGLEYDYDPRGLDSEAMMEEDIQTLEALKVRVT